MKILTDNGLAMDPAAFGRRDDLMDAFERSGLPAPVFAAGLGVDPAVFERWLRVRCGSGMGGEGAALHFVEAVPAGMLGSGLTVELAGAARVVVNSAVELEAVAELIVRVAAIRGVC
jgi:hypothetical protein